MPDILDLKVPSLGESVSEATIARWVKNDGEYVTSNDVIAELETDKATVELPAGKNGALKILKPKGSTVAVGETIAQLDLAATGGAAAAAPAAQTAQAGGNATATQAPPTTSAGNPIHLANIALDDLSPAVRALVIEHRLQNAIINATGAGGRLSKEDILNYIARTGPSQAVDAAAAQQIQKPASGPAFTAGGTTSQPNRMAGKEAAPAVAPSRPLVDGEEVRVPMSKLRETIARRLVDAQHQTASLTTFNEVDLTAVMALREKYKEPFEKAYGVGLGFMSFFAKAVCYALKTVPQVNWMIDGNTIVQRNAVHLGVAVSTDRGLFVPVVRNAHQLSMAQIEAEIKRLATRARDNKITIDEMAGGTFTITNGGVFGSLLSTPIINPPQAGILGMHKIEKRAVVISEAGKDTIAIRPMMYIALTYDHRIIDGKQSVTFLVKVKEALEDPARLVLEI